MNLENLVPLKTKGLTRNGSKVVFVGNDGHNRSPLNWVIMERVGTGPVGYLPMVCGGTYCTRADGKITEDETPMDIVQIARPWVPKNGDVVLVTGIVFATDLIGVTNDDADDLDFKVYFAEDEEFVVSDDSLSASIGGLFEDHFLVSKAGGFIYKDKRYWTVHRSSMKLVRRPSRDE